MLIFNIITTLIMLVALPFACFKKIPSHIFGYMAFTKALVDIVTFFVIVGSVATAPVYLFTAILWLASSAMWFYISEE